jgi:hypothetical protein
MNKLIIAFLAAGATLTVAGLILGKKLAKHYADSRPDPDCYDGEDEGDDISGQTDIDVKVMDLSDSEAVLSDKPAETENAADAQN